MSLKIRRAAVLGAGVMGAQIAAHLAAAGVRTHLLDLSSDKGPDDPKMAKAVGKNVRSTRAILAIENLKVLKPTPLYSSSVLMNIIPGNFDDDMSVVADCDWVLEAVIERLDIKQAIHKQIASYVKPGTPVTTNTSGISLAEITEGMPEDYKKCFFGTHFFNPARYMRLLEIIPHGSCDQKLMMDLTHWLESRLGKGIVFARDTVNFIANRIGVFATQSTLKHMDDLGINVETIDALTGPLIGRAKSATLRTMDVVGLDTFAAVARNTTIKAPNDPYKEWFLGPKWIEDLIEKGHLGQKTGHKGGCYKKSKDAKGKTEILAYRPESDSYEPQNPTQYPWMAEAAKERDTVKRLQIILQQNDDGAKIVWRALADVMSYAALLVEDIAGGLVKPIDEALKWGFNWEYGPFELWQALGYDEIRGRMEKEGIKLPDWAKSGMTFYKPSPAEIGWQMTGPQSQLNASTGSFEAIPRPEHALYLPKFENKEDNRVLFSNPGASLLDLGDGVACLTFHSKMNAIDFNITDMIMKSVAYVDQNFDALVLGNEGPAFSAGANLKMILGAIKEKKWGDIEKLVREFQGALQLMKFASFPTVSCPFGMTLGGGCEVSLHTSHRMVAGETYAGLVEVGVGLIPAGGGTKELALRAYDQMSLAERGDPMPFLQKAFMLIGMGQVSSSGLDAMQNGLYPSTCSLSISQDYQVVRAKKLARVMADQGYVPRSPAIGVPVAGDPGIQTFKLMLYNMVEGRQISPYDAFIGEKVATVLCGGDVDAGSRISEDQFLALERNVFVELCQQEKTADRIEHMLKSGRPLRN